ncbi:MULTISPECIES: alpha/beta fold hydrolase [Saliphagus]|uniref:Alpha/beta fold hydrolase n=1 Tax=Saliphagus infecundisoli TaxID=1849069 RepID=A0ABD5QHM0_9EURY|nr:MULTISPECIES: alpha/beta hydrolase [Saliphagus]
MPWAQTDAGVAIHYERDEGEGPTVVFLQEMGYGRWLWRWQREALAVDAVAPDWRGTGRSDVAIPRPVRALPSLLRGPLLSRFGYTVEDLADDLEAVLAAESIRNAHLVGLGLGGMVAMKYALEGSRAASLTLCGTTHGGSDAVAVPEGAAEALFARAGSDRATIRERMRPAFTERFTNRNPHLIDRIVEWRLEGEVGEAARQAQWRAMEDFDASDRLEEIRLPTLVLHGSADRVVPVENSWLLEAGIPDARLETRRGGSHLLPVENADWTAARIRAFLAEHADGEPESPLVA